MEKGAAGMRQRAFPPAQRWGKQKPAARPAQRAAQASSRAPLLLARYSPTENDIPIINPKILFSRLDFSLLILYIIRAVNRGFFE